MVTRADAGASLQEPRTAVFRPGIIETVFPVRITVTHTRAIFAEVERLGNGPLWLVDMTATTSFETACVSVAGTEFLSLKKKGMKRIVAVIPSAIVRMGARAASLAGGMPLQVVGHRLDAMPFLVPE